MKSQQLRKLPFPNDLHRMTTGALQFGNDCPGFYIRGDEALAGVAPAIRLLQRTLTGQSDPEVLGAIRILAYYANMIERDVDAS